MPLGIHKRDVTLGDGESSYLAGGAILKGAVKVGGNEAKVRGREIIDGSDWGHFERREVPLRVTGRNVDVAGIIVRFSWRAGVSVVRTSDVDIRNVEICASRFPNDDDITVSNADSVHVSECFVRTDDDCIAPKGYSADRRNGCNRIFEKCQLWCDRAIRFGSSSFCLTNRPGVKCR
ncbi:MAG: glycosyl hydrolase family 28 protein [Thermoguttaceae bacterium]|nr:glycosyl hydrolase family 28 protein [Thermoguttaceae bacterium]MDW8078188.1 glycosyl hydrolase family 28 protein [Thermoguttaceae bacterium]